MKEKYINYYKISTIILVSVLIIIGVFYFFSVNEEKAYKKGFTAGQQYVFSGIVSTIKENGYVSFGQNNENITLIPIDYLKEYEKNIVSQIVQTVDKNGYIILGNESYSIKLAKVE